MAEDTRMTDYYADLGVNHDASPNDIKAAFHRLAKIHHPDKQAGGDGDAAEFRKVREAYEKLSDPTSRAAFDRTYRDARDAHQRANSEPIVRSPTPPPYKPSPKPGQSHTQFIFSRPYIAWQKRYEAWEKRHPEAATASSSTHNRSASAPQPASTSSVWGYRPAGG